MHLRKPALAIALLGCGARTGLEGAGGTSSNSVTASSGGSTAGLCDPAGIRLCENPACPLAPGACPGIGCTPTADRETNVPEAAGVCWLDIPTFLTEPCTACADGDVCVHRSATELVCVPFAVCDALYKLGAGGACRYADKSPFTDQPLPVDLSCPTGFQGILCSGGCSCDSAAQYRCVGRSAGRPHGICAFGAPPNAPLACAFAIDGTPIAPCYDNMLCAVFKVGAPDDAVAQRFGICVDQTICLAAAKGTPLRCLDLNGKDQAG